MEREILVDKPVKLIKSFSVTLNGQVYRVLYGTDTSTEGYWCCVPNRRVGCIMHSPEKVSRNTNKLLECGLSIDTAHKLAQAIYEANKS